jgi:hypothetical protein
MQQPVAQPTAAPAVATAAEALGAQLASTAGRISVAAAGVEKANPVFSRAELRAAARRGETVTLAQMTDAEKRHAMAKLIRVLPLGAIAKVCESSVDELATMDAERLAHHFVTRGRRALWTPGTTNDCRNVWARFRSFWRITKVTSAGGGNRTRKTEADKCWPNISRQLFILLCRDRTDTPTVKHANTCTHYTVGIALVTHLQ